MFEKYFSAGYDLYQPFENGDWVISPHDKQAYHGSLSDVCKFMVSKLEFDIRDIEEAIELILTNGDNAAHFGIFRTLIYTYTKTIEKQAS